MRACFGERRAPAWICAAQQHLAAKQESTADLASITRGSALVATVTYPDASRGVAGQQHLAGHEGAGADSQPSTVHHAQGRGQLCQVAPQLLL